MYRFAAFAGLYTLSILGGIAGCKAAEEAKKDNSKVTVQKEIPAGKRLSVQLGGTADSADLKLLQTALEKRIGGAPDDFAGVTDRITEADATLDVKVAALTVQTQRGVTSHTIFAKCIYNVELVDKTDGPLFSAVIEDFASEDVSSSVSDTSAKEGNIKTQAIKQSVNKLFKEIQRCVKQEDWSKPRPLVVDGLPKLRIGMYSLVGPGKETLAQWSAFIEQQIGAVSFFELISQAQLEDTLKQQQLMGGAGMDERTVAQLGKLVGAKYLVEGTVVEAQGRISLTLTTRDLDTNKKLPPVDEAGNPGQEKKVAYKATLKLAQEIAKLHQD